MRLFNEIYGIYYRITTLVLEKRSVTEKDIRSLIDEHGTDETRIGLSSLLIPAKDAAKSSDWGFFERCEDNSLKSILVNTPKQFLTTLEKKWLKARLRDRRIRLFLSDETIQQLEERLSDVTPLYTTDFFRCFDRFSDGDDMTSEEYIHNFRICLKAYKERKPLLIKFLSGHGNLITLNVLPLKLEYSFKNDKFRLYCRSCKRNVKSKRCPYLIINIGRIISVEPSSESYRGYRIRENEEHLVREEAEPIKIRVTEERNSVERFMLEFAAYPKITVRDPETGECIVTLDSKKDEETEILIRLLGFGPTIEILSPPAFRAQAADRIFKQYERFFGSAEE